VRGESYDTQTQQFLKS